MEKSLKIIFLSLLVVLFTVCYGYAQTSQQGNSTQYNYQKQANKTYQQSVTRYQNNPTSTNRQVMKQRKQVKDMRDKQFGK